jgi:hypothetical protein
MELIEDLQAIDPQPLRTICRLTASKGTQRKLGVSQKDICRNIKVLEVFQKHCPEWVPTSSELEHCIALWLPARSGWQFSLWRSTEAELIKAAVDLMLGGGSPVSPKCHMRPACFLAVSSSNSMCTFHV